MFKLINRCMVVDRPADGSSVMCFHAKHFKLKFKHLFTLSICHLAASFVASVLTLAETMETLLFSELDENLFQGILVVSATDLLSTEDWLKQIIDNAKHNTHLEFKPVYEDGIKVLKFDVEPFNSNLLPLQCHSAKLDNKYYTTQIYLVALEDLVHFPEAFYDFFHGVLIYFDNNEENGLKAVDKWIDYIDMMDNCAIKILACESVTPENLISRINIHSYCIEKGFELVELRPKVEPPHEDDLEDDFKESNSFERLYQAIQAYVWPNLNYKQKGTNVAEYISRTNDAMIKKFGHINFEELPPNEENSPKLKQKSPEVAGKSSDITSKVITEQQAESFESLFGRLSAIKDTASKLENKERKRYAEKVAMAFLASVSDDKDEISGFSSEEESEPNHVYI